MTCGMHMVNLNAAQQCVPACRYCYVNSSSADGTAVAQEMIREACLWSVLANGNPESSRMWWGYKARFMANCNSTRLSDDDTDPEECSEQVRLQPRWASASAVRAAELALMRVPVA